MIKSFIHPSKEVFYKFMKILDMKIQQQLEQASEARVSQEQKILYEDFYQRLRDRKPFSQAELNEMQRTQPGFYDMVKSLERDIRLCESRLENCRSREAVWRVKEDYLEEISLSVRSMESNSLLPWEKKLEYMMFKDTKISVIEELIDKFAGSAEYEKLPEEEEDDENTAAESAEKFSEEHGEVTKENSIKYAKAKAIYNNFGRFAEEEPDPALLLSSSFEAKG